MKMTTLCGGLLLASTLTVGCRPRVPKVQDATTAKNSDGSVKVTHSRLKVALDAPTGARLLEQSPRDMRVVWGGYDGGAVLVEAPDAETPMTLDELKLDLELRGSTVRFLDKAETDGGGYNATFTYRDAKFRLVGGYYSVQPLGAEKLGGARRAGGEPSPPDKIVCAFIGEGHAVRGAKSVCETLRPLDSTASSSSAEATPAAATTAAAEKPSEAKPDLEALMTPPEGLLDLRPILGTDRDVALPKIFEQVKKGMTAKELDAIFPGVANAKQYNTYTSVGKRWRRFQGNEKYNQVLELDFDDAGGLKKIGYTLDEKDGRKPGMWDYFRTSAFARWGKQEGSGDWFAWEDVQGVKRLTIHNSQFTSVNVVVEF
jgi:hypothetical protein